MLENSKGERVKVIVPGSEVHKLRATKRGDHFELYSIEPRFPKRLIR